VPLADRPFTLRVAAPSARRRGIPGATGRPSRRKPGTVMHPFMYESMVREPRAELVRQADHQRLVKAARELNLPRVRSPTRCARMVATTRPSPVVRRAPCSWRHRHDIGQTSLTPTNSQAGSSQACSAVDIAGAIPPGFFVCELRRSVTFSACATRLAAISATNFAPSRRRERPSPCLAASDPATAVMSTGATRSTPPDRLPLFPRTRRHAPTSTARS